jgi:hypothetical protein
MTLLLDGERVVRQAIVGSTLNRRSELIESTARLMALIQQQEQATQERLQPKPRSR